MILPQIIQGASYLDHRGAIRFVNDFDMGQVKRCYVINNADTTVIRAWRAHRIEQRWFCAVKGSFCIKAVKIDDWEMPTQTLPQLSFVISDEVMQVLHIPLGYATSVQALQEDASLMVFADYGIENAVNDNYLYPVNYFV